jgi:hypothetical protein
MHALAFNILSVIGFSVFYSRIHSVTMERADEELLENAAKYKGLLIKGGVGEVRAAIADPRELPGVPLRGRHRRGRRVRPG